MSKRNGASFFRGVSRALTCLVAVLLLCLSAGVVLTHYGVPWDSWLTDRIGPIGEKDDTAPEQQYGSVAMVSTGDVRPAIMWSGVQNAVISGSDVPLMNRPEGKSDVLCRMKNGEKAIIIGQQDDWYRIRRSCFIGWVPLSSVRPTGERTEYTAGSLESERAAHASDAAAVSRIASDSDVDRTIDSVAATYSAVGAQVAVIKNGEVVYVHSCGYANRKEQKLMTDDTKIRSASVSKVGVAMAAIVMAEQGIVDLDADISDYLGVQIRNPSYRNIPITLRMLLIHDSTLIADISKRETYNSFMKKLGDTGAYRAGCKPGVLSSWAYSNAGICLAGMTLEAASGVVLVDFIDDYFFAPMGVDASYHPSHISDSRMIADLYEGGKLVQSVKNQLDRPYSDKAGTNFRLYAGDLTISAKDLARMMCILANDGTYDGMYYMSPESVSALQEDYIAQKNFVQCLTIRRKENFIGGHTMFYHTGNAYGTRAFLAYDDQTRDGIVIITTGADEGSIKGIYTICYRMAEYLYETLLS